MSTPPHQNDTWTAPASLPTALTSAADALFAAGMANPRGCEYRQIAVVTGNVWSGGGSVVQAHGWVLPVVAGQEQSFAICWNGLVYPAVNIGSSVDLAADVQALVTADAAARAALARANPSFPFFRPSSEAVPEDRSVSEVSFLPLKVCLLLRAGHVELAQAFWGEWTGEAPPRVNDADIDLNDPYLILASDWAWALFDRAVTAHMRGDDQLSFLSARLLTAARPLIEAEAARRDFPKQRYFDTPRRDQFQPYLDFLDPLPALLADAERRMVEPERTSALTAGPDTFPTPAARIVALIQDLENVSARQWGQPGGVSLGSDPIVVALIAQGDDAVPPLLDTLVHDDRLTRSVCFGRDFHRRRSLLSVSQAACVALGGILQTSFLGIAPTGGDLTQQPAAERQRIADAIRAYWLKHQRLPLAERWYRMLADDAATAGQWLQAAGGIVQPANIEAQGDWIVTTPLAPGREPRLRGAALREKTAPTVSALLAKRVAQIAPPPGPATSSAVFSQMRDATKLALLLARWDARAAVPVLRAQMAHSRDLCEQSLYTSFRREFTLDYAAITQARLRGGDPTALADYDTWLRGVQGDDLPHFSKQQIAMFAPLWQRPDDPEAQATAQWAFDGPPSLFNLLLPLQDRSGPSLAALVVSPLLGLPAVQRQVMRELADPTPAGTLTVGSANQVDLKPLSGPGHSFRVDTAEALPPVGTAQVVQQRDLYAMKLATVAGMAQYDPFWPNEKKAQARAADIALLSRLGARFAYIPDYDAIWGDFPDPLPHLTFPAPARPATEADVQAGRAIFALSGQRRVWKMPAFPLKARRLTLRDAALPQQQSAQDGWVWQAEEQQQADGNWKRFYGFVGPHEIVRVPASEVEFPVNRAADPSAYSWVSLLQRLDARIAGPTPPTGAAVFATGLPLDTTVNKPTVLRLGDPLPLTLAIRNRSGLTQSIPGVLARTATLRLFYAARDPAYPEDGPHAKHDWRTLPPKPGAHFPPLDVTEPLEPTASASVLSFDLNDWFALTQPGYYRAEVTFAAPGLATDKLRAMPFQLQP